MERGDRVFGDFMFITETERQPHGAYVLRGAQEKRPCTRVAGKWLQRILLARTDTARSSSQFGNFCKESLPRLLTGSRAIDKVNIKLVTGGLRHQDIQDCCELTIEAHFLLQYFSVRGRTGLPALLA